MKNTLRWIRKHSLLWPLVYMIIYFAIAGICIGEEYIQYGNSRWSIADAILCVVASVAISLYVTKKLDGLLEEPPFSLELLIYYDPEQTPITTIIEGCELQVVKDGVATALEFAVDALKDLGVQGKMRVSQTIKRGKEELDRDEYNIFVDEDYEISVILDEEEGEHVPG